ncbi:hypothetical protein JTB14_022264 [Gonioctena quinquepunctata]|nr:hypothetical protein JTB14_022264 [Gonioctena quinquepunctata]
MKFDVELLFECLMYLNAYYFPVFAISEVCMTIAKHYSEKLGTPNLGNDAMVTSTRHFFELLKIILFQRYKEKHRKLVTTAVLFMTLITIGTVYYTVSIQYPTLKLENVLSSLTIMLMTTEIFFGLWCITCYRRVEYY